MKINTPKKVEKIMEMISGQGYQSYLVGGCIRDILLGKIPKDWDLVSNAPMRALLEIFEKENIKIVPIAIEKGTIQVILDKEVFELSTFRYKKEEGEPSLKEDLGLRDFTINAMAYHLTDGLKDPFNGRYDLRKRVINAVGDAEKRFQEDPLRIIRAVRLAAELDFSIHPTTIEAIHSMRKELENISPERIKDELNKILLQDKPSIAMQMLKELELLEFIIPELNRCVGFDQNTPYHHKDIFDHTLVVLDATPKELVIRLAALLHDIAKPICFTVDEEDRGHFYQHDRLGSELAAKILKKFRYSNKVIKQVSILAREHMQQLAEMKAKTIKRLIGRLGEENIQRFFQLRRADILGTKPPYNFEDLENFEKKCQEIENQSQALTVRDLDINGDDLIEMGMVEGIKVGKMLEYLLDIILDQPELNEKSKLKKMVIRNFKES